jgi:predicted RNA binding protein YcfA (HicA-like mRNA interferase family)
MPKSAKAVAAALQKKGFIKSDSKDVYYRLYIGGKKTQIFTKISHGEREIHDGLLGAMARQVRLTRKQFNELIDCPLQKEQYVQILVQANMVES